MRGRSLGAGVSSLVCLSIMTRMRCMPVCAGPDVRATGPPLCFCVLCNMRKSQSELGARTLEEKGSHQCGQQDAVPSMMSS